MEGDAGQFYYFIPELNFRHLEDGEENSTHSIIRFKDINAGKHFSQGPAYVNNG